jgi:hypothetical protein
MEGLASRERSASSEGPATRAHPIRSTGAGRVERANAGRVRWAVLMWALGVPLPLVLLFLLFRGCA